MHLPSKTSVFIDQKLIHYQSLKKTLAWSIDSLIEEFGKKELFFTLYRQELDPDQIETYIIYEEGLQGVNKARLDLINLIMRDHTNLFRNFFVSGLILLLIAYTIILNTFGRVFKNFYDIGRTLSLNIREEYTFKGRVFSTNNLVIILTHSFLMGFIAISLFGFSLFNLENLGQAYSKWALISVIIFLAFVLKFWLLLIIANLFDLNAITNRHYLEFLRMSKIFFGILFILMLILFLGFEIDLRNNYEFLKNLIIIFLVLRVLLLYFKFIRSSSLKNLYLISYLCGTELIPLVIGLKIFKSI